MNAKIKTILLATDFSGVSQKATQIAADMSEGLGAKLYVMHAFDMGVWNVPSAHYFTPGLGAMMHEQLEEVRIKGRDALDELIESLGVPAEGIFAEGRAGHEIVENAEKIDADLIVVGSHGYTGWNRLVLGSVAEHVVRHANCAVMTVKAPEEGEEEEP